MKISYNWLKWYLPDMHAQSLQAGVPEIPDPKRLEELFTYHVCEVESVDSLTSPTGEKDWIFDIGVLPNRAHDLLSHQGVASELAGLLGIAYKDPTMYKIPASSPTSLKVEINTPSCRRYMARIVRNIKVGPSPDWVKGHLESIGQRSINNIVDATNLTMYDCGQPCHAFDLKIITNDQLLITNGKEGEELKVVGRDGIVAKLKDSDVIISSGGKTLALGGVKGGLDSGIQDDTTDIVIEVANFDPTAVRKTARRLNLLSDSAKRFENDLSPEQAEFAMAELTGLLVEFSPDATFEDVVDVYSTKQEQRTLSFSCAQVSKKLGLEIPEKEIEKILKNYGYEYIKKNDIYTIEVPALRLDLEIPEDMVEEIGRVYGYDKVVPVITKIDFTSQENEIYEKIKKVRDTLKGAGYKEVMTYAFANAGDVEVLASASDKKFLRTNLTDGLKKSYEMNKLNMPLLGLSEIKIFEIGTVFSSSGEEIHICYANKKEVKETNLDSFLEKIVSSGGAWEAVEPSTRNFSAEKYPCPLGESYLGEKKFTMWSLYPFIARDIAVWVPEGIKPESLKNIYIEFGTELLQGEPILFDQFTKDGRTSYAFRLIFQSYDRTLTDDEVGAIMGNITEKLSTLKYEVR